MMKAPFSGVVGLVLGFLDRRLATLARLIHTTSTELHESLHLKSAELHESLHRKSDEAHASLHLQSAELHASLNALHGRAARLEALCTAALDARPIDRLEAELAQLRALVAALDQRLVAFDQRVTSGLGTLAQQAEAGHETYLESLSCVGRALRDVQDQAHTAEETLAPASRDGRL